jgi:hypothetical protein
MLCIAKFLRGVAPGDGQGVPGESALPDAETVVVDMPGLEGIGPWAD